MPRNTIESAVILRSVRFAEYHKRISLLTEGAGLIEATAYGAFKGRSKLAGATESFVQIRGHLYFEPVRARYKLSDADAIETFDGIRNNLKKFYVASLISELILVTYAGGDEHASLFPLLVQLFSFLSECPVAAADLVLIQAIQRFLALVGFPAVWSECAQCGVDIRTAEYRFVSRGGAVLCNGCRRGECSRVTYAGSRYISATESLEVTRALQEGLDESSISGLQRGLVSIAQSVVETPLRTLNSAAGYL